MWAKILAARFASATMVGMLSLGIGGVGVASAAQVGHNVDIEIAVQPTMTSGTSFTDTMTVSNAGRHSADKVRITVPFDPASVQLTSVQFNKQGPWVTSTSSNSFQAYLGNLDSGSSVQVTMNFSELAGYAAGNTLPTSVMYNYVYNGKQSDGTIDTELLSMQETTTTSSPSTGAATTTGGMLTISSSMFAPGEQVVFWYNTPDGQTLPLYINDGHITMSRRHEVISHGSTTYIDNGHYISADSQGKISIPLSTSGLTPGMYTLVAHGLSSSTTNVIPFQVQ